MNKAQAAKMMGISIRTLQRYMSDNKIGFTLRQTKAGQEVTFDREELRRFKRESPEVATTTPPSVTRMTEMVTSLTTGEAASEKTALAALDLLQQFTSVIQEMTVPTTPKEPTVAIENKLMLSVKEASDYSGISQYHLKHAIRSSKLKTIRGIGRGHGKIRRDDLIEYVKNLDKGYEP